MKNIEFIEGNGDFIDEIAPLWEKLNQFHKEHSVHFGYFFGHITFDERKNHILSKAGRNNIKVELAFSAENRKLIGYCVSSIYSDYPNDCKTGEINSLFLEEDYRGLGIGERLMNNSMKWMNSNSVSRKIIGVSVGNEEAFKFYERSGFYPHRIILEQKINPDWNEES